MPEQRTDIWTPISKITDTIWAGGGMNAEVPDVDAILRLQMPSEAVLLTSRSMKAFLWLPIPDGPPAPSLEWLAIATSFLDQSEEAGYKIYVHCTAGVSRTGLVLVAYFMLKNGWSLEQAFKFVQDQRPPIWPNQYFMQLLKDLETDMFSLPPEGDRGETTN